jgi:hypothetical protein
MVFGGLLHLEKRDRGLVTIEPVAASPFEILNWIAVSNFLYVFPLVENRIL